MLKSSAIYQNINSGKIFWECLERVRFHIFINNINFKSVLEYHVKLRVTELDFPEELSFAPKNWVNGPKMGQK